ncbi:hypothetical protein AVEN_196558-1 [Araneus ventricosus]|uniref:Uncharacterized protein n=1 Tax=Araneus ventricosus TaxID=182803 RepID=A0A4Y2INK7_ARAVE|nr:hypothetical protein AVEN_196558-1 [Araneus ventricosus]
MSLPGHGNEPSQRESTKQHGKKTTKSEIAQTILWRRKKKSNTFARCKVASEDALKPPPDYNEEEMHWLRLPGVAHLLPAEDFLMLWAVSTAPTLMLSCMMICLLSSLFAFFLHFPAVGKNRNR